MNNIIILLVIAILGLIAYLYYTRENFPDIDDMTQVSGDIEGNTVIGGKRGDGMYSLGPA